MDLANNTVVGVSRGRRRRRRHVVGRALIKHRSAGDFCGRGLQIISSSRRRRSPMRNFSPVYPNALKLEAGCIVLARDPRGDIQRNAHGEHPLRGDAHGKCVPVFARHCLKV